MNSTLEKVLEFHQVFDHPVNVTPTMVDFRLRQLRITLIAEELKEFAAGCGFHFDYDLDCDVSGKPDMVEIADGLGDLDYVVQGANLVFGLPGEAILAEIHRSNMSKAGADGRPIKREDGKILKGPHYFKPDIEHWLWEAGWKR